ncbi:MAG: glycosyltransferase [bacterium]
MVSVGLICGPTGGHIIPAYLVGRELRNQGADTVLYTVDSEALNLLPDTDLSVEELDVKPWSGRSTLGKLQALLSMASEYLHLRTEIADHDVLISFGGYPAVPGLLAAWEKDVTVYFQEQNRVMGRTHRLFQNLSTKTFHGFPPREGYDDPTRVLAGNPVREPGSPNEEWFENSPLLVVVGGSQGSREVSEHLQTSGKQLIEEGWSIYYVTGKFGRDLSGEPWAGTDSFRQVEYDHNLQDVLSRADCVWSRAGAGTLSELISYRTPALVFPFGSSTDNHQRANANWVSARGPVDVVDTNNDPSGEELLRRTESLRQVEEAYSVPWDNKTPPAERIAREILSS